MSGEKNQQMRDARLKKALDSAPDSAERPADAVREAILDKARLTAAAAAAAASLAPPERRRRGWLGLRSWNPALATLGALVFVSVSMWNVDWQQVGQEPLAEAPPRSEPTPAPAQPPAQAPAADPSPVPAAVPALKPPPRPVAEEAPAAARRQRSDAAAGAERAARVEQRAERRELAAKAEAPVAPPPPPPAVAMAPPQPQPQLQPAPTPAPLAAAPPAPAPPPAAAVEADAAPRAAQGQAPASESVRQNFAVNVNASALAPGWFALRFLVPGDTVLLPRAELPLATVRLLSIALRAEGSPGETFDEAADLRIELMMRGERAIGLLELSPTALRWTPAGQPPRVTRPAQLGDLRAQLLAALAAARAGKPAD